jgi:hypothetical protein
MTPEGRAHQNAERCCSPAAPYQVRRPSLQARSVCRTRRGCRLASDGGCPVTAEGHIADIDPPPG